MAGSRFPGLTQRRRERGEPVGKIEQDALAAGECICGPDDDPNDHRPDCPLWRIETRDDCPEAGGMSGADGLGR